MFCATKPVLVRLACAVAIAVMFCNLSETARAQFFRQGAVGGVKIDADGVLSNPEIGELKQLQAAWQQGLDDVPADLEKWTDLRFVSLRQLEAQIADANAAEPCRMRFDTWPGCSACDTCSCILSGRTSCWLGRRKVGGWTRWAASWARRVAGQC
jgi:hypothetical protein